MEQRPHQQAGQRLSAEQQGALIRGAVRSTGRSRQSGLGLVGLVVEAAVWLADRNGRALPGLVRSFAEEHSEQTEAAELQRSWLDGVESKHELNTYVAELIYSIGDSDDIFEQLSSESMRQVAAVAALTGWKRGSGELKILDLAAGSGSMLLSVGEEAERLGYAPSLSAVELVPDVGTLAAATLFLSGLECDVRVGDSLIDDPFEDRDVDLAISQPPFGMSWRNKSPAVLLRQHSGWYPFGLPPTSDSTWLFASRLLEKLKPPEAGGGRAVTFVAPGALVSRATGSIREQVLEADLLQAVIALPRGLTQAALPLFALVFSNVRSERRRGQIQVVDLRASIQKSGLRTAPRRLRPEALATLATALGTTRDGPISRMLPRDYFLRSGHTVRPARSLHKPVEQVLPSWEVDLPRNAVVEDEMTSRYGPVPVEARPSGRISCDIEFGGIFDPVALSSRRWLGTTGWSATRLSALLIHPPTVWKEGEQGPDISSAVLMPITLDRPATAGEHDLFRDDKSRLLVLHIDTSRILAEFLAGWFNSPLGREARSSAYSTASSGSVISIVRTEPKALVRLCDEVLVPLPPLPIQQQFVTAESRFAAAGSLIAAARREAWVTPSQIRDIEGRFAPLFDRSLTTWAGDLPYPVASALWALETKRQNPDAAHRQIFLVWEAYAAFFAAVLLSALSQDPILQHDELPRLRQALATIGLSMERPTLGTWSVIVQRLSGRFREQLGSSDTDEQAAVVQTFGGASHAALERLLHPDVVRLITDANGKRNAWAGHSGTVNETEQASHVAYLTSRLEELREVVGSAWRDLQCVRAGEGYKERGRLLQKVELVVGQTAPFRQTELRVGELMEKGELYMCADGAARPLPLQHFVVLRSTPPGTRYTSYFYNRREGDRVRLVSYQLADTSEVFESLAEFAAAIDGLIGPAQER